MVLVSLNMAATWYGMGVGITCYTARRADIQVSCQPLHAVTEVLIILCPGRERHNLIVISVKCQAFVPVLTK